MTHLQIELTMRGSTKVSKRQYHMKAQAMQQWDKAVDSTIGGDKLRLVDLETGRVVSEYHPVEHNRSET